jgi:hypothetical protein
MLAVLALGLKRVELAAEEERVDSVPMEQDKSAWLS